MDDLKISGYTLVGVGFILILLACVAIGPFFINESNRTAPPQRSPAEFVTNEEHFLRTGTAPPNTPTETIEDESLLIPSAGDGPTSQSEEIPTMSPIPTRTTVQTLQVTPTVNEPLPLELVEKEIVRDEISGQRTWFVVIENPNTDWYFEDVEIRVLVLDGNSKMEVAAIVLQSLFAGERSGLGELMTGQSDVSARQLSVQIEPGKVVHSADAAPMQVEHLSWQPSGVGGQVTALVTNLSDAELVDVTVLAIVRAVDGTPIAIRSDALSFLPGNGEVGAVIMFPETSGGASAELYLARTSTTRQIPDRPPPLVDVITQGVVSDGQNGITLWAAIVESRHEAGTVVDSEVFLTLLDSAGNVIGVRTVDVAEIRPQSRTAIIARLDDSYATGTLAEITAYVRFGDVVEDWPGGIAIEDTLYLDDQGIPRVESFLRSSVDRDLQAVALVAIAFDASGAIVGAGVATVEELPAFGWSFAQVRLTLDEDATDIEQAEMFVAPSVTFKPNF
jgi:hypothetical protein